MDDGDQIPRLGRRGQMGITAHGEGMFFCCGEVVGLVGMGDMNVTSFDLSTHNVNVNGSTEIYVVKQANRRESGSDSNTS